MKKYLKNWHLPAIVVLAALLLLVDLPAKYQTFMPQSFQDMHVNLGLDLQGGSQLDYKIDLRNVADGDKKDIIDGVTEVINKRVNNLGVAEPNIYNSKVADEDHIIVELAGIKDLNEAKATVGKTIQLEFKEENTEIATDQVEKIKTQAQDFLNDTEAKDFEIKAEEEAKLFPSRVSYALTEEPVLESELPDDELKTAIQSLEKGQVSKLIEQEDKGFIITKVVEKNADIENEVTTPKSVEVSHILIAYEGADKVDTSVSRTKSEAKELAKEITEKAKAKDTDFSELAKEYSDGPSASEGGKLANPVTAEDSAYVPEFTEASMKLEKEGDITLVPVETGFGFHIIKANTVTAESTETKTDTEYKLATLFFSTAPDPWKATDLNGKNFKRADVSWTQMGQPQVSIQFDDEGGELFEELTSRNVNKRIAIFVGGEEISSPVVNQTISGGQAVITGQFTTDEAADLARNLNTGAIPAPITLTGQYTIGASLGQEALTNSVKAGIIGLLLLILYIIGYYRLKGIFATIALSIYAIILFFLIKVSLPIFVALLIALTIFFVASSQVLKNDDPFWEKATGLLVASFALFFFTFLLSTPVVLTLAGVAGVILSIGMAVDANVLIFERIKEELQEDKNYTLAVENGFDRAWASIRDSNFSSLITCAILYYFGSSIIRGFALNLAAGILVSMFTAITVTKSLMLSLNGKKILKNTFLLGINKAKKTKAAFKIIEKTKIWLGVSSLVILIGLGSLFTSGIQAGIDFKGGTLLDIQFSAENIPTIEQIKETLASVNPNSNSVDETSTDEVNTEENSEETTESNEELNQEKETPVTSLEATPEEDLTNSTVISSGENSFIIRTSYVSEKTHNNIIQALQELDPALEETRFTTIGPVISQTLKQKAITALIIALIAIVLYIAFAFRNVPKEINKWKFGACAIIALVHDVLITLGIFSIFKLEVDALFITALLTIIGFSIHDTIVVFDRLRENLKGFDPKKQTFTEVGNTALTQTMARSINTSVSTLITLLALLFLGSPSIFNFVLALVIGVAVGTYSSIFIATPLLNIMQKRSK